MEKNKKNTFRPAQLIKSTKAALKNKFVLSSVILITIMMLALSVSYVMANSSPVNVHIYGDIPNDVGKTYYINAFSSAAGGDSCPASNASGNLLAQTSISAIGLDPYNDDNDYSLNFTAPANTNLYIYYCTAMSGSGDLKVLYHQGQLPDSNVELNLDLGKIYGQTTNADLDGYRAIICDEPNGRELSNQRHALSVVSGGSYEQYYVKDHNITNNTVYIYFDSDVNSATCAFDPTIDAGKRFMIDQYQENYGVYYDYSPDTKIESDLHSLLNGGREEVMWNTKEVNLGLVYTDNTDCNDDGNDNTPLYYDNPTTIDLRMDVYPTAQEGTSIYDEALGFTQQDAVARIYGTVPSTITSILINDGSLNYETSPDASGNYNLYVRDGFTGLLNFSVNGTVVYSIPLTIPETTGDGNCINIEVNLGMVTGEAHSDLETGDDIMAVYGDNQCTERISYDYNPSDVSGTDNDYVIYFNATGHTDYYMNQTMIDGSEVFHSCGNIFQLTNNEKHDHNITVEVWGYVPDSSEGIQTIGIMLDGGYDNNFLNNDLFGEIDVSLATPEYHIFSVPDDDASSTINFYKKPGWSNDLALYRTKNLTTDTEATVPLHAAKLKGTLDSGFVAAQTANRVYVYDEFELSPVTSYQNLACDDSVLGGAKYIHGANSWNVYFEVTPTSENQGVLPDGDVAVRFESDSGFYTWRTKIDKDPTTAAVEPFTGGEDIHNFDLVYSTTGDTHTDIKFIELIDGADWIPAVAETDASNPRQYWMLYDSLTSSSGNWEYTAHTNPMVLRRDQSVTGSSSLDGDIFNVGKVLGEAYTSLENGDGLIEVYSTYNASAGLVFGLLSSEIVHPADNTTGEDFEQYFEAAQVSYDATDYYLNVTGSNNSIMYSTMGHAFQTTNLLGTKNLVVDKGGIVPNEIVRVAIDYDQDGTDEASTFVINNEYHLWATEDADGVDISFYDSGNNKVFETTLPSISAGYVGLSVSKLIGDVPFDFAGDTIYLENPGDDRICGSGDEVDDEVVANPVTGSPDYKLYFVDNGSNYTVLYCDGGVLELQRDFISPRGGNNTVIKHVAKLNGTVEAGFRAAAAGSEMIYVYDSFPGSPLNSHYTITDGGLGLDSYHVFFESTTLENSGDAEGVFYDQNNPGNNEYVVRYDLDDNIHNGAEDGITPGSHIDLNMDYVLTGMLARTVNELHITDSSNRTPVKLFVTGTWPHGYNLYYDSTTASGTWQLNAFDQLYTAGTLDLVLSRAKGSTGDATDVALPATFNVSRVLGDAHWNLEDSVNPDDIQIYEDVNCTIKLSSEARQPSDDGYLGNVNDYMQYLEDVSQGYYYINIQAGLDSGVYNTCGNLFNVTVGGTNSSHDLIVEKTGNVTSDIIRIGADLNEDGTDDAKTQDKISNEYHLFTLNDSKVDVHYYDSSALVFTIEDEDWGEENTYINNVDSLIGDVDTNLDGGEVLLFNQPGKTCADVDYLDSGVISSTGSSPDYVVYMLANGTRYYAVFCDASANKVFEWKVDSSDVGANVWRMDVGEAIGEAHAFLEDGNDTIEIYDGVWNSTHSICGENRLSTEQVNPADDSSYSGNDYAQFFLMRLNDSVDFLDYGEIYCKKITDDDTSVSGNTYVQYELFEVGDYGDTVQNDLDALKYGLIEEEAQNAPMFNVSIAMRIGGSPGTKKAWTNSVLDGTYRLFGTSVQYDFLYEKTGWIDEQIDDELLSDSVDTENNIVMLYTVKVKAYDELGVDKPGFDLNIYEDGSMSTCVEGDDNMQVNNTNDCDADDINDSLMYWAYSPGESFGFVQPPSSITVDISEYLNGYVYQYANGSSINDKVQLDLTFYNPFTIRVVDVFNELGYKLDIETVADQIGEATVGTSGPVAMPTGIQASASSVYGDPRGEADNDLFMPLEGTSTHTLTASAPGYVLETIDVVPDPHHQQTVMYGDYDRNCSEGEYSTDAAHTLELSQGGYSSIVDYCDDDQPQRLLGDGLLYTLRLNIWDEKVTNTSHLILNPRIVLNNYSNGCYTTYKTGDELPAKQYDDDPEFDDEYPHIDYDWDPITKKFYIPAIGGGCDYYLEVKKDGYVTRGDSDHGIITRPDEALGDVELSSIYQTAINFSKDITCDVFAPVGPVDGVSYEQCSGMPYSLKVNAYDQFDNPITGFTVVVEDSGLTLPESETGQNFCWIENEIIDIDEDTICIPFFGCFDREVPTFQGVKSYEECVLAGGTVRPIMSAPGSYSFDKQFKPYEQVYDFGFDPTDGDYGTYYSYWKSKNTIWDGFFDDYGAYCSGIMDTYEMVPGAYLDIVPDKCSGYSVGESGYRLFVSGDVTTLGTTNTYIITDGERGFNSSINRTINQSWLPDFSWQDGYNGQVLYPLNAISGTVDNPLHIHISKPGYEADTKSGIVVDSLYQVVIDAIMVDNVPPEVHITSPEEGDVVSEQTQVIADVSDSGAPTMRVDFYYDSTFIGSDSDHSDGKWNVSWDTTGIAGPVDLKAIAIDINSYSKESDLVTVIVDNTIPNAEILAPEDDDVLSGVVDVETYAYDEEFEKVEFYVDTDLYNTSYTQNATFVFNTSDYSDGDWILTIKVYDIYGLVNTSDGIHVTIDNTAPDDVVIVDPRDGPVMGYVDVDVSMGDAVKAVKMELYANGCGTDLIGIDTEAPWSVQWNTNVNYTDGVYELCARAIDIAGHMTDSNSVYIVVDNTAPVVDNISVVYPTGQYTAREGQTVLIKADVVDENIDFVTLDCSELGDESGVSMSYNGGNEYTGECTLVNTSGDFTATIAVRAIDLVHKMGQDLGSVEVDNTAPIAEIDTPVDGSVLKGVKYIYVSASDSNFDRVELWVGTDKYAETTYQDPDFWFNSSEYSDGDWILTVVAYDDAGNMKVSDGMHYTIDNTAPDDVVIVRPDMNEYLTGMYRVDVSAGDAVEAVSVTLYDGVCGGSVIATDYSPSWSFDWNTSDEPDGSHTLCARATDIAGHTTDSELINITVDNTDPVVPVVEIFYPDFQNTVKELQTFTVFAIVDEANIEEVTADCTMVGDGSEVKLSPAGKNAWNGQCTLVDTVPDSYITPITVTVTDKVGRTGSNSSDVEIDNIAPTVEIMNPFDNEVVSGLIGITTLANDTHLDLVEVFIGNDLLTTTSSGYYNYSFNTSLYSDGDWILTAKAYDDAGHVTLSDGIHITIDNTAPDDIVITSPKEGEVVSGKTFIEATAGDAIELVNVSFYTPISVPYTYIDSDEEAPWSAGWDTTVLSDGQYSLVAKATDIEGHYTWSYRVGVIVDNNAPDAPSLDVSDPNSDGCDTDGDISLTWTEPSDGSGSGVAYYEVEVSMDPTFSSGVSYSGKITELFASINDVPAEGTWYARVKATDLAGHVSNWSNIESILVDRVAPSVVITAPEEGSDVSGSVSVTWTTSETSTDALSIDGDSFMTTTSPYSWGTTVEEEGAHTLTVRATDACGNVGLDQIIVQVDNTPECIEFTMPYVDVVHTEDAYAHVTAPDTTSRVDFSGCGLGLTSDSDGSNGWTMSIPLGTGDGACTVTAEAFDELGNSVCTRSINLDRDNTAPTAPALDVNDPNGDGYDNDADLSLTWTQSSDDYGIAYYETEVSMDPTFSSGVSHSGQITELFASFNDVPMEGTWYARVKATDLVGHESSWSNVESIIVDTIAPVVWITTPGADQELSGSNVLVAYGATEINPISESRIYIDGSMVYSGPIALYYWNTTDYNDGNHEIKIEVEDAAGNVGEKEINVLVDNTPECISFITPDAGEWYTEDQVVEVTSADDTSRVDFSGSCTLSPSSDADGSNGWTSTANLSTGDGSCTITAEAFDENGDSICSRSISVNRDNTAPNAPALDVNDPDSNGCDTDGDISLTWTEPSDGSGVGIAYYEVEVSMDQNFLAGVSYSGKVTELFASFNDIPAEGTWYARVKATDMLGHTSVWSNVESIIVDTTAPTVEIISPEEGSEVSGTVSVSWTTSGSDSEMISIDGDDFISSSSPYSWDTDGEEEGAHTLTVKATDSCGNTAMDEIIVQVDNTPECLAFVSPEAGEWYTEDQLVEVTSSDETSEIEFTGTCGLDPDADTDGSDGWTSYANLDTGDGSCTITAEAFDELSDIICSRTITVYRDNTEPTEPVADVNDPNDDGYAEDADVTFTFESDDTGVGVDYYNMEIWCSALGKNYEVHVTETYFTFNDLEDGLWCGEVYAVDKLGNSGPDTDTGCIIVDTVPPTTVIVSSNDVEDEPYDTNDDYEITWTPSTDDNGIASYDIMINGDITEGVSAPLAQSPGDGTYHYKVRAVDNAGNRGEWSATYTVIVDTTPPDVMIVNPEEGGFSTSELTLSVVTDENAECDYDWESDDDDGSGSLSGETTTHEDDLTLPEGDVGIEVTCVDMAGNVGSETVYFTVTNDLPATMATVVDPYYASSDPTITAQVESQNSEIEEAKYCLRRPHESRPDRDAESNCFSFEAQDGDFNEMKETVEEMIDISGMEEGIWVAYTNARDGVDWGEYDAELFIIDTIEPIIDEENPLIVNGSGECYEDYEGMCSGEPISCETASSSWSLDPELKCLETIGCDWVPELADEYCEGTPDTTCFDLGDTWGEDKCLETDGCEWEEDYEDVCVGTPTSCEAYDEDQCALFDGCDWTAGGETCEGTPATDSCEAYDMTQCNDISGCTWTLQDSSCSEFHDEGDCLSNDCSWDTAYFCTECGMYSTEGSCPTDVCTWYADSGCVDNGEGSCFSIYDESQCIDEGCSWWSQDYCYGESTYACEGTPELSCSDLFSYGGEDKCLETEGCDMVGGASSCEGVPTDSCEDIQSIGVDNGYLDKCTETPGCDWDEELVDEYCDGTPEQDSCEPYDYTQCTGIEGCDWIEEYDYSCEGTPGPNSCRTYDEAQCYAIEDCGWYTFMGWQCEGGSEFELELETNEDAYCEYSDDDFEIGEGIPFDQGQWTDQHLTSIYVEEDGTYVYYIVCMDYAQHESYTTTTVLVDSVMDHSAPEVINSSPEGKINGTITTLMVETDEYAVCEYSTTQFEFGEGTEFDTTGTTVHEQQLNLADGSYAYFVKCRDYRYNKMKTSEEIVFEVDTALNFAYSEWLYPVWDSFFLPRLVLNDLAISDYSVVNVLDSIGGSYDSLYYNNGPSDWSSCVYDDVTEQCYGDLTEFNDQENKPYWIKMLKQDRLEID